MGKWSESKHKIWDKKISMQQCMKSVCSNWTGSNQPDFESSATFFFLTTKSLVTKTNKTTAHSLPLWLDYYSRCTKWAINQAVLKFGKDAVDWQYTVISFTKAEWIHVMLNVMMPITESNWNNNWKWSNKAKKTPKQTKKLHIVKQIKSFGEKRKNRFPLTQFKGWKDPEERCKDVAQDLTIRTQPWDPLHDPHPQSLSLPPHRGECLFISAPRPH